MKKSYQKPPLTIDEKIIHLQEKGMVIVDKDQASKCLLHISYYRLSAYWLPFEISKEEQNGRACFLPNTSFETVLALYNFDLKLRHLVNEAISDIEIAVRGNWAYQLSQLENGFGYLNETLYRDKNKFHDNKSRLKKEFDNSKEIFANHFKQNYEEKLPPVWMSSEILSFGSLSHWYANLKDPKLRQSIAKPFQLDKTIFQTYIHHLSVVRNICAHHGRLWNRSIQIPLKLANNPHDLGKTLNREQPKRLYNTLVMLAYSKQTLFQDINWQIRTIEHINTLPYGDLGQLGFPNDWENRPIWSMKDQKA